MLGMDLWVLVAGASLVWSTAWAVAMIVKRAVG